MYQPFQNEFFKIWKIHCVEKIMENIFYKESDYMVPLQYKISALCIYLSKV